MTHTTVNPKKTESDVSLTDRFEKWIQAPVTHYGFTHVGEIWQPHQTLAPMSSSAGEGWVNIVPNFQYFSTEVGEDQLMTNWLALADTSFDFWNNEIDAAYDNL